MKDKTYKLIIDGRLPGLNEYQDACRRNKYVGAKMKKEQLKYVSSFILQQLSDIHIDKKLKFTYKWYEKNKRRDLDNISSFGRKVIQDALVESKVIDDDRWKNISGFTDEFYVDKDNPRIEVYMKEDGKAE